MKRESKESSYLKLYFKKPYEEYIRLDDSNFFFWGDSNFEQENKNRIPDKAFNPEDEM